MWTIIAVSFIVMVPFIVNAFFAYPMADDFFHAQRFSDSTIYEVCRDTYYNWSGRYFATFISILNPLILECVDLLIVYSIVLLFSSYIVIWFLIRKLCGNKLSKLSNCALTGLVMTSFLSSVPSAHEFYYWFSAYITYTIPVILQILFFGICINFYKTHIKKKSISFILITIILLFVIVGSNEFSIIQMHAFLAIAVICIPSLRKNKYVYILYSALLLFTVFSIIAPGNFKRFEICNANVSIVRAFLLATYYSIKFVLNHAVTYCISGIIYICCFAKQLSNIQDCTVKIHPAIFTLLCIITLVFLQFFSFYTTLSQLLCRTENGTFLLSLLFWFCIIQMFYNFYSHCIKEKN